MRFPTLMLCSCLVFKATIAQNSASVSGTVKNSTTKENIPAVSVTIKGTTVGTYTDEKGNFRLTSSTQELPFTLVISSVGYTPKEVRANTAAEIIPVEIDAAYALGQDIVVAASRVPERILESPVSIERINVAAIRTSPAVTYYDVIGNLKGVDLTTSSLTFKTVSTRGFNGSGNPRFNQIVDGMDNQAPGLNFSVGGVIGLTELDVDNLELLSGASSALYGPGGMNGTLLVNSKDPFKYQGLSFQVKQGINHVDNYERNPAPYYDWAVRWGKKLSDKFAFKFTAQLLQAKDWIGTDVSNYRGHASAKGGVVAGTRDNDPAYDGVNIYGDETVVDIRPFLQGALAQNPALAPIVTPFLTNTPVSVSRTGFHESQIIDNITLNFKLGAGVYYMLPRNAQISLVGYWGTGNTVYTGSDRYSLKDLKVGQYKIEVKNKNWFLRAYTTQENAGESFNATVTSQLFNEAWKRSFDPANIPGSWYPQYTQAFLTSAAPVYQQAYIAALTTGQTPEQANATAAAALTANALQFHNIARVFADQGKPEPGTATFKNFFDAVRLKPISEGGGLFLDKTNLYMAEGQYNLTDVFKIGGIDNPTEVLIGGNYKQYILNSEGTLFADTAGRIRINEYGGYLQLAQRMFSDVLKLTASARYDKNENFKGRFTPRVSAVITVAKNHNIRLSYQTTYRFPSTQNQWINLTIGGGVQLIGGLPDLRNFYHFKTNPVYTIESFQTFAQTGDPSKLIVQNFDEYKPESATSYEAGYKGLIANKFLIDVYAYTAKYQDFLGRITVLQSSIEGNPAGLANPNIFSVAVNSSTKVRTQGWGASIEYLLPNNFNINANVYSDEIKDVPANFVSGFNTPKYRTNIAFGNTGFLYNKRIGFNIIYRWQDKFFFEGDFAQGEVSSFSTFDGQISYKLPKNNCLLKLGATNLLNKYYRNGFGNPQIGGLYYISFGYNVF